MGTSAANYTARPTSHTSGRHIGLFVRSFGGGGGAERVMLNLATGLADQGHRVDLVMGRKEGHFLDEIPDKINIIDLKVRSAYQLLPVVLKMPRVAATLAASLLRPGVPWILGAVPGLAAYLNQQRPAALLSALSYPNIAAVLARRLSPASTRMVISVHNHLSVATAQAGKAAEKNFPQLARRLYPEADRVVAVSDGVADDLAQTIQLARSRITTIYNPVFRPDLMTLAQAPLEHAWFAPGAPPVILGIGKLKPQKDFGCLIRAFARVRADRPARLLILGEGSQREAVLSLARQLRVADDIALPGFVANPFAYLGRAAVFALSSAWEGLPTVIIEALACGCPIVSTDCPSGPAELLERGAYGSLVPVGDDTALAQAILATLDTPPHRDRLLDRARQFSVDRAVEQYLSVLLGD
jgi:glycosyltransferase involved in cell wall biosynthesis